MKISYHGGHSGEFCCHASDSPLAIVEAAIARGFSDFALTEHLPSQEGYLYPEELSMGASVLANRFSRLMDDVRPQLKQKYAAALNLWVGFETEFYGPDPLGYLEQMIARYSPELVVGSLHHVRDIPIDFSPELYEQAARTCGGLEELYCSYYDQQYELIQFLAHYTDKIPVVLGHMDLIRIYGNGFVPTLPVWERMVRNIKAAVAGHLVFEVNSRAFKKHLGEPYPNRQVLAEIKRQGGLLTFGDDSHAAIEVGLFLPEVQAYCRELFDTAVVFKRRDGGGYAMVAVPF